MLQTIKIKRTRNKHRLNRILKHQPKPPLLQKNKQTSLDLTIELNGNWQKGENCSEECTQPFAKDCMGPIVEIRNNPIVKSSMEFDNFSVYIDGEKVTKGGEEAKTGEYSTGFGKSVAAFNGHYAYVLYGPYCLRNRHCTRCSTSNEQLIYDGKIIYETPFEYHPGVGIIMLRSESLYGDQILTHSNGIIYNGQNVGNLGTCMLTKDSYVCLENTGESHNVYYGGQKVGQVGQSESNMSRFVYGYDYLSGLLSPTLYGVKTSNNNMVFRNSQGDLQYFKSGKEVLKIGSQETGDYFFYDIFGNHLVYERKGKLFYDGKEIGHHIWNGFRIFGNSLAYLTECNKITNEGHCPICTFDSKELCEKDSNCTWFSVGIDSFCTEKINEKCFDYTTKNQCNNDLVCVWEDSFNECVFVGQNKPDEYVSYYLEQDCQKNNKCFWSANESQCELIDYPIWLVWDGAYYNLRNYLKFAPGYAGANSVIDFQIFGNHIALVMELCDNESCSEYSNYFIYDFEVIGKIDELGQYALFDNHYIFERADGHIVYNGKDLGKGTAPTIYGDHYVFFEEYLGGPIIYDGKRYDNPNSIVGNMVACYRYYLDSIPTKPFGEVSFD